MSQAVQHVLMLACSAKLLVNKALVQSCRYMSTDEQLYKDIEGVLEQACDMFKWRHMHQKQLITRPEQLTSLLEFWDGVCHLFTGRAKPSHWVANLLRALKLFTASTREQAVSKAETTSAVMTKASVLWEDLKAPRLKALFETIDVADDSGAASKRQRRTGTYRLDS